MDFSLSPSFTRSAAPRGGKETRRREGELGHRGNVISIQLRSMYLVYARHIKPRERFPLTKEPSASDEVCRL